MRFVLGANVNKYDPVIRKVSKSYAVDYALVNAVIKAEIKFDPQAISGVGTKGLI